MTEHVTLQEFSTMLDRAGLHLTESQKSVLFEAYPLLRKMIDRATPDMPREAEPAVMFSPEVMA